MILYSHNKTSSWLEKQPLDDRKKLIEVARKLAPSVRKKFNERRQAIEERRADALLKRQEDITCRKMRATQENDKITQEILNRGDIEGGLQNILKKAKKLRILKVQLKFRQKVLAQPYPDSSIFVFSSRGKAHSLDTLKENLGKLVDDVGHRRILLLQSKKHLTLTALWVFP